MKKHLSKYILLSTIPFMLIGCNQKKEEPITNKDESTIIKNAKSTDEYIKKEDYKSIAYAYIYNIKEGLTSYESETNGTLKAKIMFFNYDIKYHSVTHKSGNVFYSKDNSTSTFSNVKNEFYMADKEKILVSRDLKKYDVYKLDDYHKISYSPNQYTIMGYVFNDESINKAELVTNENGVVSIKYTLDNELATSLVKVDMKNNGDLTQYPSFKKIELTLSMKTDFTPISYSINSVYDASKPVFGSTEVTQQGECLFSKVNESIVIPNEADLIAKLGVAPSEVVVDDPEKDIKNGLLAAAKNLDFASGVNVNGNISLNLLGSSMALTIDSNVVFDMERLSQDKIYDALSFYAKVDSDENFGSLISLVRGFLSGDLSQYQELLDNFKSLEVVYDGNGGLYLIPTNQDATITTIFKVKLTDILDLILKQINIYNLVNGSNEDYFDYKLIPGSDKDNYQVEITLTEATRTKIKDSIDSFFQDSTYALIKTLLGYKDFGGIKLTVTVANGKIKSLDGAGTFIKAGASETDPDTTETLISLHFDAIEKTYDFTTQINKANELMKDYNSTQELKARINELTKNVYVNRLYLEKLDAALTEYKALTDQQKAFVGKDAERNLENAKADVDNILLFLETYKKYDLSHMSNEDILNLTKAYRLNSLNTTLLASEIGKENQSKLTDLSSLVDYSAFDSAVTKLVGEDENAWGLSEAEIRGIKLLFDIAEYEASIKTQMLFKLLMNGNTLSVDVLKTKINTLYNNLPNP